MPLISPLGAGLLACVVGLYYDVASVGIGRMSRSDFIFESGVFVAAIIVGVVYAWRHRPPARRASTSWGSALTIIATVISAFVVSGVAYLTTDGMLGGGVGVLLTLKWVSSRSGNEGYAYSNRGVGAAIVGLVIFVLLRSVTIDVLTMRSSSLSPRVQNGQRVLINNLAVGVLVPFLPYHILRWGHLRRGDLVLVPGPHACPFLREVLKTNGPRILVNREGWLPSDTVVAKGFPL